MSVRILWEFLAACIGTVAFALLFQVPKKYYGLCGLIGGVGFCSEKTVPRYGVSDFRNFSAGAGSRNLLDGLLYCDQ